MCDVMHPFDLLGKVFKVRDDKVFSESFGQQHDVVSHTPAKKNVKQLRLIKK